MIPAKTGASTTFGHLCSCDRPTHAIVLVALTSAIVKLCLRGARKDRA